MGTGLSGPTEFESNTVYGCNASWVANNNTLVGNGTFGNGSASAFGFEAKAQANAAAFGQFAEAGNGGLAFGSDAKAVKANDQAFGQGAEADAGSATVIGQGSKALHEKAYVLAVQSQSRIASETITEGVRTVRYVGQTTSAASSNVTYPGTPNDLMSFNVYVSGRDASTDDVGAWSFIDGVYANKSGTGVLTAPTKNALVKDVAAWDSDVTLSGNNLSIEFSGAANTTVDWVITLVLYTTPFA